jgi:hypothetical protein
MNGDTASCNISIAGKDSAGKTGVPFAALVEKATADLRLMEPSSFEIKMTLRAGVELLDEIKTGMEVRLGIGQSSKENGLILGEINTIEPHFSVEQPSFVTISGFDFSHRLSMGSRTRVWGDGRKPSVQSDALLKEIIRESGGDSGPDSALEPGKTIPGRDGHYYIPQMNASDRALCDWLALANGGFIKSEPDNNRKLNFLKPEVLDDASLVFVRTTDACSNGGILAGDAEFRLCASRQYRAVEIRSWDPVNKKVISGKAETPDLEFGGESGGVAMGKAFWEDPDAGRVLRITDIPVWSEKEAEEIAARILTRTALRFIRGRMETKGNAQILAGNTVEFKGFGKLFSGRYLVTRAVHSLDPARKGFTSKVEVARTDIGM